MIDWNIRAHPRQELVEDSRIGDDYERTNIWRIQPAYDKRHPTIFPAELAEKVISYYSFKGDVVLDPFAGIGTVGEAAVKSGRRFVLIEQEEKYVSIIRERAKDWLGDDVKTVPLENFVRNFRLNGLAESEATPPDEH
ncbi:MAG: DNA methyltransferase [Ktedonobacteraceae bacterium]